MKKNKYRKAVYRILENINDEDLLKRIYKFALNIYLKST